MLLDGIRERSGTGGTILDVGGGVGAIQHALLEAGAERVINVDAAPAFQAAVQEEAERRGYADRIEYYCGDVVELSDALPPADVVTLDRVVCCYPDMPALLDASLEREPRLCGLVFPRRRWLTGLGMRLINLFQRLRGQAFRVYLHDPSEVERRLRAGGMERIFEERTFLWRVEVFERQGRTA